MPDPVVDTPQFASPFRLNADGTAACVEQDSAADIEGCVLNILVCPTNWKLGDPEFGSPSMLFGGVPLDMGAVLAAIQRLEPRAQYTVQDVAAFGDPSTRFVNVSVTPDPSVQQT